jgi:glutamine synthetase
MEVTPIPEIEQILQIVEKSELKSIRFEFCDFHGICRSKEVPANRIERYLEDGINFAVPTFTLDLKANVVEGTGYGEEVDFKDMTAKPDLDTFSILPWQRDTARFVCDLYFEGSPLSACSRGALKRLLKNIDYAPVAAGELEFYLLNDGNTYFNKPSMVYSTGVRVDPKFMLRKIRDGMDEMGIDVIAYNHEFSPSQYEVNIHHTDLLKAADNVFTFKNAVKEIASIEGLLATFMPKPFTEEAGNSFHIHQSLSDGETNLFHDESDKHGLSDLAYWFIGGQLKFGPEITAFLCPTINSYKRLKPMTFAPYNVLWGLDNRTTYIRIPPERDGGTRVENRLPDASANPYLVFTLLFGAGLEGIKKKMDPGDPFEGNAYVAEAEILPQSLGEAIELAEKSKFCRDVLGKEFVKGFLAVKRFEVERFENYVTDWELEEYMWHL